MELIASLPSDWLAIADPAMRGPAPLLADEPLTEQASAADSVFALLLASRERSLPAGESLPVGGNALPSITPDECEAPQPVLAAALFQPAQVAASTVAAPEGETADNLLPRLTPQRGLRDAATTTIAALRLPTASALPAEAARFESLPLTPMLVDAGGAPSPPSQSTTVASPTAIGLPPLAPSAWNIPFGSPAALAEAPAAPPPPRDALIASVEARAAESSVGAELAARNGDTTRGAVTRLEAMPSDALVDPALPDSSGGKTVSAPAQPLADIVVAQQGASVAGPVTVDAARAFRRQLVVEATAVADPSPGVDSPAPTNAAHPTLVQRPLTDAVPATNQSSQGAAVDTRAADWHQAFADRVRWIVDQRVGEARIKLNPPELGAVDVKISLVDDKTFVQVTAHSAAARDEIAQGLPRLRELFTASGLELGGANVRGGHDDRGGQGGTAAPARFFEPVAGSPEEPRHTRPASVAAARIDVFA